MAPYYSTQMFNLFQAWEFSTDKNYNEIKTTLPMDIVWSFRCDLSPEFYLKGLFPIKKAGSSALAQGVNRRNTETDSGRQRTPLMQPALTETVVTAFQHQMHL